MYDILYDPRPIFEKLLDEAATVDEYMQGFKSLDFVKNKTTVSRAVEGDVEWAIKVLKKHSRIVWYLRWIKLNILELYARDEMVKTGEEAITSQPASPRDNKIYHRELRKFSENGIPEEEASRAASNLMGRELRTQLEHFYSDTLQRNVPKLAEYEPGFKKPDQVIQELTEIEEAASSSRETASYEPHRYLTVEEITSREGWEKILDVGNGWFWWEIPSNRSTLLARAMSGASGGGHCGTCQEDNSTILILCEPVTLEGEPAVVPHLSFELSHKNMLLQMKGYKNSKPEKKYYPAIVKLLIGVERIEKVKGGKYKPETDFKLSDLSEEQRKAVEEVKPEIGEVTPDLLSEWERNGPSDEWMRLVQRQVDGSISFFEKPGEVRERHLLVEYDIGVSDVERFVKDYLDQPKKEWDRRGGNDLSRFIGIEQGRGKEDTVGDFVSKDDYLEEPPYGISFESHVTKSLLEKVLDKITKEYPEIIKVLASYLEKNKEPISTPEELASAVMSGKSPGSDRIREVLKRAVMFGFFWNNPYEEEVVPFMAYVLNGFYMGPFYSYIDTKGITSYEDFMNADISFITGASELMEYVEGYIPEDWDGDSDIFGYEGISSMVSDDFNYDVRHERTFQKFLDEEWGEDEEEFLSKHMPDFNRGLISDPEVRDLKQQALPGMQVPREYDFDLEAAVEYFITKIRGRVLEQKRFARRVLDMIEKIRRNSC